MVTAKRKPSVIAGATISGVRKNYIVIFIVTNPVIATISFYQFLFLTAQPANWNIILF
ncbi:MAG: hypothetical protein AAB612_01225 [Patescibacteria group bacterium]